MAPNRGGAGNAGVKKDDGAKQTNPNAIKSSSPNFQGQGNSREKGKRCLLCEDKHNTSNCQVYGTLKSRKTRILQLKLCIKCLSNRHEAKNCPGKGKCRKCGSVKHNMVICSEKAATNVSINGSDNESETEVSYVNYK
jgi:hypothetical protein